MDQQGLIRTIPVRFEGTGSGEGSLTWAQMDHWGGIADTGQAATVAGAHRMPEGTTVEEIADLLRFIVSRHQALRTRLRFDDAGLPRQVCSSAGEVGLSVVDAGADDPVAVAEAWKLGLRQQRFDFENDWPVRMAVILSAGVLTHVVTVYLHLAVDGEGIGALLADVAGRDPATGAAAGPVTATQPLELASRQAGPAALRRSAASLAHLEQVMRAAPPAMFGRPRDDGPARYRAVRFRSPATALAIARIVHDQQATPSAALLAAFAVGLARHLGQSTVWAMVLVSNRFQPGCADSVSMLVQSSPYLIDVSGRSLAEVVSHTRGSLLHLYKTAYYHGWQRERFIERLNRELSEPVDFCCFYNHRHDGRTVPNGPLATDAELRAALARSSSAEEFQYALPTMTMFFNVDEFPHALEFPVSFDSRYFDPEDVLALTRQIEAAAVETAITPQAAAIVGTGR